MADVEQLAARMICVGFDGYSPTPELIELLERGVSAVILFTRNYESPEQLRRCCSQIKSATDRAIMICIDQEGGRVQRLRDPFSIIPSMRELGQRCDVTEIFQIGQTMAAELRDVQIDMNLAPVLDVDSNPANPVIGERAFSSNPERVSTLGCALIRGLQQSGVAACGKHFPGHGDTSVDSHFDLPRLRHNLDRLKKVELPPFQAAIRQGVASILVSHVLFEPLDAEFPSSMSRTIVHELLRDQMGFDGVVIADDLEMKAIIDHFGIETAVVQGTLAGVDLFPICHSVARQHAAIDAIIDAVNERKLSITQLETANRRLDVLFDRYVQRPAQRVPAG